MIRSRPLLVAFLLLAPLVPTAVRAELVRYELVAEVQPPAHHMEVRAEIRLPARADGEPWTFQLDRELQVVRSRPPVKPVAGEPDEPHLTRYAVPARTALTLTLEYEGVLHHRLSDQAEEYTRGFRSTPGTVGPDGVFLSGGTGWYPVFDGDPLLDFTLDVSVPEGWHLISQGGGTSRGDDGRARWASGGPMDEIYLVGGPLHVYADRAGDVRTLVYLREPDTALAARYLTATARYLEMYRSLIGPHPYPKFALVENFWETGFGMPSFTLLGPKVIRFPFILHSSYPHEILHDWWGNSVFVAEEGGNWCEGLTAYLADHLIQEQRGKGADYRRAALQRYRDHVREARDFPLTEFRSRHDAATEAVGYGKSLMGFHGLRLLVGDDVFRKGLVRFYREQRGKRASFRDIQAAMELESKEDLEGYFDQWIERTGAPALEVRIKKVTQGKSGYGVRGSLRQVQEEGPFAIDVPVVLQVEGGAPIVETVHLDGRSATLSLRSEHRPLALLVDPQFDVFRRLDPKETPSSLSQIFGEAEILAVLPHSDPVAAERYRRLVSAWQSDAHAIRFVMDEELEELPRDRAAWLLGRANRLAPRVFGEIAADARAGRPVSLGGRAIPLVGHCLVATARHPANDDKAVGFMVVDGDAPVAGLARKLPHYGKYSYLAFEGGEPENVHKGQWAGSDSPLLVDLRPEGERGAELPPLRLAPADALAELPPVFSAARLGAHVERLTSTGMDGRLPGSPGHDHAVQAIARAFREAGLSPGGDDGTFLQELTIEEGPDGSPVRAANVVGYLPGTKRGWADQAVVVSAHLDHLGRGWPDAHSGDEGLVHPGADDNASGVAVLVELARAFALEGSVERNLLFIAFTGEEAGRLGSRHYVRHPTPFPLEGIRAVVNLDSVGRLEGRPISVLETGTATEWPHVFRGVGFVTGIESTFPPQGVGASDQMSFIEAGIPAVQVFSGPHLDYHRPGDTADKIDAEGMVKVATFVKEAVAYLVGREEPLTSTIDTAAAEQAAARPAAARAHQGRRVSFGSIPEFSFPGPGVKLTGVVPGSPADGAGLRAGDVVTAIDGRPIADLKGFSEVLKSLEPGDTVEATVVRGPEELSVDVTLTQR